ncbi:MAG: MBL fold metallo-hydrolase [Candidatus Lokiarchaeota archaeon]|nr:MBL fold metallo-hydrolase [Candidatus Lokiarchaeota archaeon]
MIVHDVEDLYWYSKDKPVQHLFFRGFSSNIYVIDQGDELWQIDAGTSPIGRPNRLFKWMKEDGINPDILSKIFLTHSHLDHVSGLNFFCNIENLPIKPILYCHKQARESLEGALSVTMTENREIAEDSGYPGLVKVPLWLVEFGAKYAMGKMPEVTPDQTLEDGEIIKGQRYNLETIHTPGHTRGHCCYYIPSIKALYVGDLIDPECDCKPPLNLPNADYDEFKNSIKKLLDYEIEYFCMPHAKRIYRGIEKNHELIELALGNLELAEEVTIDLLKKNSTAGLRIKDFRGKFPKRIWNEVNEQYAVGFSIIKSLMKRGKIRKEGIRFFYVEY